LNFAKGGLYGARPPKAIFAVSAANKKYELLLLIPLEGVLVSNEHDWTYQSLRLAYSKKKSLRLPEKRKRGKRKERHTQI